MASEAQRIAVRKPRAGGLRPGQYFTLLVAFVASAVIGYAAYSRIAEPAAPVAPVQTIPVQRGSIAATVSATGSVVASQQSKLTFATSGTISQVKVGLGDKVKAGQVLATVDTSSLEIKLAQAKSNLKSAQIKLDSLKASATSEDVAAAKAAVASAQAKYNDLIAGPTDADVKAAEQGVISAQASLTKAQGDLAKLKAGLTQDDLTIAKADLDRKQAALTKAQSDYDKIAWRGDIGARPEAVALQSATSDYQSALAAYNLKIAPPKPEDVATSQKTVESATAALESAQAKLDQIKAGPKTADVQSAHSSVASAQAQLAAKTAPASDTDLATQQEQINNAQLAVKSAELDLSKASLAAPFDGVIAALTMNPGEQSGSSSITLVNPDSVRIDVTVDETDLSKLSLGKTATVAFDALPDTQVPAKVVAIAPSATVQQGVVTYLASLSLDTKGVFLPQGMTANVSIVVDKRDNVLLVPNRAVRTQGRTRVVDVVVDGKPETRQVSVGMSNDQSTEVTSGLQEGDVVAIRQTTTSQPRGVPGMGGFGGPPGGGVMMIRKD